MGSGYSYHLVFADEETAVTPWQSKIRFILSSKVPSLQERVEDDGNSGGDGNEEDINHEEFFPHQSWAASTCNFVPLMFLQRPYFSAEGALGLPKAKSC